MYALPLDLDRSPDQLPPVGQWRVIDLTRWDGWLVRVVGDYAGLSEAMDQLKLARHPYTRAVINDMGVQISSVTPGSDDVPQAGSES